MNVSQQACLLYLTYFLLLTRVIAQMVAMSYSHSLTKQFRRLRFSSDADIVRLTNARIIIIIIIIIITLIIMERTVFNSVL